MRQGEARRRLEKLEKQRRPGQITPFIGRRDDLPTPQEAEAMIQYAREELGAELCIVPQYVPNDLQAISEKHEKKDTDK